MEDDWNIKLTDFGISEFIDGNGVPTEKGTARFMAPEVIYSETNVIQNYSSSSDIWKAYTIFFINCSMGHYNTT